ncbi:MAG: hypothetical protein K6E90_08840 [Lachnospiraceae bacterium]|nr:hypothetical protein [Lachnospiraceae bacterium]
MGKDSEEGYLRRISRERTEVHATSESMNVSDMRLMDLQDPRMHVAGTQITSPIMSQVDRLQYYVPVQGALDHDLDDVNRETGIKISSISYKRKSKIDAATKRQTLQQGLANARSQYRPSNQPVNGPALMASFDRMNPDSLMNIHPEHSVLEHLETNYDTFHDIFGLLPDFAAEIDSSMQQLALREQANSQNPTPQETQAIAAEKERLARARAKLKTFYDVRAYYEVQERIASSRYFVYVEQDKMLSLSYEELRKRLEELYRKPQGQRNTQLIDYYQNLIRLKELNLSDSESVEAREAEYLRADKEAEQERMHRAQAAAPAAQGPVPDKKVAVKELKKIAECYASLTDSLVKRGSVAEPEAYTGRLFDTFGPDIREYLRAFPQRSDLPGSLVSFLSKYDDYVRRRQAVGDPPDDATQTVLRANIPPDETAVDTGRNPLQGIEITRAQAEGIRSVSGFLLQSTKDNLAYTYNVISARPEQQLLMFYLMEHDRTESAMGIDFHTALHNYIPNVTAFSGSFSWKKMSIAVRKAMQLDKEMRAFAALSEEIKADETQIARDSAPPDPSLPPDPAQASRTVQDKIATLTEAIGKRGVMLRMLYRNAGLHEDMPPDMAADPALREQLFNEFRKIGEHIHSIQTLVAGLAAHQQEQPSYADPRLRSDTGRFSESSGTGSFAKGRELVDDINAVGNRIGYELAKDVFESGGSAFKAVTESAGYLHASGWAGGVLSLASIGAAIMETVHLVSESGTMTTAGAAAGWISNVAEYAESGGELSFGIGAISAGFTGTESILNGLTGSASNAFWNMSTTAAQASLAGGILGLAAGAIKIGASSVKVARAKSSLSDVGNARGVLDTYQRQSALVHQRDQAMSPQEMLRQQRIDEDQRKLRLFLDHQEKEQSRQRDTAACGIVSGVISGVAGGFMMTGYLAPIGAIIGGVGLLFDLSVFIGNRKRASRNRLSAVDSFLGLDSMIAAVRGAANHPMRQRIAGMSDDELREPIRQEALAMLGFMDYKECFHHVCETYATLMYNKVFYNTVAPGSEPPPDLSAYRSAMESLGLKIDINAGRPTIQAMVGQLMKV